MDELSKYKPGRVVILLFHYGPLIVTWLKKEVNALIGGQEAIYLAVVSLAVGLCLWHVEYLVHVGLVGSVSEQIVEH